MADKYEKSCSTLPRTGGVLGVDVGFSMTRRSSAACRLDWTETQLNWTIRRFRALLLERTTTIADVVGGMTLEAAAFDGPLRAGFDVIGKYRIAEQMLTRRLAGRIGKPVQSSAPVGKALNAAANDCVRVVIENCSVAAARHAVHIDQRAIIEAFPSSFLGVMVEDPAVVAARRGDRSDVFYKYLADSRTIELLLQHLLPRRRLSRPLREIVNHDDRAAFVCAITALAVAAEDFTAVGDANGWIILPPRRFVQDWAWRDLELNASACPTDSLYAIGPSAVDTAPIREARFV